MEENNGCIILKKKEYQELLERAKELNIHVSFYHGVDIVSNNLTLGPSLVAQIKRLISLIYDISYRAYMRDKGNKLSFDLREIVRIQTIYKLANLSRRERNELLEKYKDCTVYEQES